MTDLPRFTITMKQELVDLVDAYKAANNFSTRSKAIHHLITVGLEDLLSQPDLTDAQAELIKVTNGMPNEDVMAIVELAKRIGRKT